MVAIEIIKGPTGRRKLNDVSNKLIRYPEHFKHIIVVLFDVNVNERYYKEWYSGLTKKFPEVIVIRKN